MTKQAMESLCSAQSQAGMGQRAYLSPASDMLGRLPIAREPGSWRRGETGEGGQGQDLGGVLSMSMRMRAFACTERRMRDERCNDWELLDGCWR